jgi:RecA/RadA recombinase
MPTASALRIEIERSLEHRFPAALTPAPRSACEIASTGIAEVDALFDGGLPIGAISEITGAQSSGRTSIACAFLAQRTRDGQVCAWVDANDAFDPESAAAAGISLAQLLWVRCNDAGRKQKGKQWPRLDQALQATDLLLQAAGFGAVVLDWIAR